ncbi:MAG: hypothetical protein KDC41_01720, partial [Saprospiraceae bacterium]|nr:hypothetical protein [Saprospiraceae bacterium]
MFPVNFPTRQIEVDRSRDSKHRPHSGGILCLFYGNTSRSGRRIVAILDIELWVTFIEEPLV